MYLMKIRYGNDFCNRVGYCFRLIFAIALMPWLRKYRVLARPELMGDEVVNDPMAILPPQGKTSEVLQSLSMNNSFSGHYIDSEKLKQIIRAKKEELDALQAQLQNALVQENLEVTA
uniref:Uncharacterized protein n=1 Tax=Trieres chinensis TaxID=1514140 RepID=A0A7S2EIZ5_TRICV|mmetsp:Transcript_24964/g.50784  ORF Transcript_24964/g.50784 Transcript_24964/m.50784 type:complete len:117 (+) Transcript_24964:113-463(+)|eukprot:CAMPEP_0183317298 /NCGR_PEP_ID=MMETSP0160_2-20130417/57553_1 /TAXON_ID=2839 ORGANISM="Odontella Sinensis, Strain Grunow 1884" /NCGR_SAMPLE_ID=MMETSP0160_2 /ASSEMBLY_ACC=CAM_ASM_000250 /LENGTH=116 /DNA_ID=CAMNT_0025483295 /DNA_START=75 /DNA_END=425 /DNA_ORIENTATION=+